MGALRRIRPFPWGEIDVDEQCRHYDDPANGDLQEAVSGKFVAFRAQVTLQWARTTVLILRIPTTRAARGPSAPACAWSFSRGFMGVSTVVRLDEPRRCRGTKRTR
jgi:hypothetical protein